MRLLRNTSISRKLKVVILTTTSIALLIASAAFVAYDLLVFRQSMASDLSTLAKVIGTNSTAALTFNDRDSAKEVLSALTAKQNIVRARVYTSELDLFAEYLRAGETGDLTLSVQQGSRVAFTDKHLIASEIIYLDDETIGTVYLISNLDPLHTRINRYAGFVVGVLLCSLMIAFLLSSKLQGLISNPISHLAKTARAVSIDKDYTIRAVKHGRDEMGLLIDGFNEMLGQIQERDAKLQNARDELERRVEDRTKELQEEIAERNRIEEALRHSEEHFRSLIENGSDMIAVVNLDGTLRYVSPSVKRVLGYEPDQMVGKFISEYAHPDDTTATSLLRNRTVGDDPPVESVELRFKHHNGDWRTLEVVGRLVPGDSGRAQIIINSRDITERKKAERELRISEGYRGIVWEGALNPMRLTDAEGNVVLVNDAYCKLMERPRAELEGCFLSAAYLAERHSSILEKHRERFRSRSLPPNVESEVELWNGKRLLLEVSFSFLSRFEDSPLLLSVFRDVTQSRKAEEALRESEERYKTLFESAPDGIMIFEADGEQAGRIVAANPAAAENTGYSVEELLSLTTRELQPPEQIEFTAKARQRIVQGQHVTAELLRLRKDGTTFPIEVKAGPLILGDKRYVLSFGRDITQRMETEKEVTMLAHAVRSIQECVSITDTNQVALFVNDAFVRTYGFQRDEVIGKPLIDLVRVDSSGEYGDPLDGAGPQTRWEGELLNRRKDGTVFPIHLRVSPIHDDSGQTIALAGVAQDISERKQIAKEVTMLAHAMRSINEFIVVLDLDGNIIFVNDAVVKRYGYERDELIGNHVAILVSRQAAPEFVTDVIREARFSGFDGELISQRKDGTEFPIFLSASEIQDENGNAVALVGVAQDITERKRAIEELKKAKEAAESASRAKSEFLANMSHEIRTPMNGIIGMTELALDTELTAEQQEYLKLVKLSADSLLGVINDILDFSKIEAGKLELNLDEFNLQDAIDDVMKALGVRAEQKGVELAYYLRPGVPEVIIGDLGRLRQVLVNLVGNAIKFTAQGEVIVRVEVEAQTDEEIVLHFGIRDTGIGVPLAKQKMIFESFTQADGSTTRKYGGTGLGLAISSQLVAMMGGQMWVESPVNLPGCPTASGSMFHVIAHFGVPQDAAAPENDSPSPALKGLPVLVVDDNATNRRILEVQLANWNMSPVAVDGASAALSAIRRAEASGTPFKMALLDFHMPGTDGLELTAQIRSMPSGGGIKIILLSSSVHNNQAHQSTLGVDSSLVKPVKATELLNVIKTSFGATARSQSRPRPSAVKSARPSRIVVAEDSTVNQTLIKRLLEKWGHVPTIVGNGAEALLALNDGQFDLILMDLQMPELNGFEATAAIREKERDTGKHIPIIALTAHALKGDRERCIEAGMDDYVSKPIESQMLFDAVEAALGQIAIPVTNGDSHLAAIDQDALMKNFDGDRELIATLSRVFADSSQKQLAELAEAIAQGDAAGIERAAHVLKGSVSNFRADAAVNAAARLELIGQNGDLALADSALAALEIEIGRLRQDLEAFEEVTLA
jgi:PAS domain S-box-containing protein